MEEARSKKSEGGPETPVKKEEEQKKEGGLGRKSPKRQHSSKCQPVGSP